MFLDTTLVFVTIKNKTWSIISLCSGLRGTACDARDIPAWPRRTLCYKQRQSSDRSIWRQVLGRSATEAPLYRIQLWVLIWGVFSQQHAVRDCNHKRYLQVPLKLTFVVDLPCSTQSKGTGSLSSMPADCASVEW